jgi:hypothetical protein
MERHNPVKVLFICLAVILLFITPGLAQEPEQHPLLQMLALVPETGGSRQWLNYADYRAMEAARGIESPTAEDFESRTDLARIWLAASSGLNTGMRLDHFLSYLTDMPSLVGFSFFDIDQSMTFGQPPEMGTILRGNFDSDQIAEAYSAREFSQTQEGNITLWCGPEGCESGLDTDLAGREVGNPFGGDLGRKEPLAVFSDHLLGNSPDFATVDLMIEAAQGPTISLIDLPDYQAAAQALISGTGGNLVQAQFISPLDMVFPDIPPVFGEMEITPAPVGKLPLYSLAVLADTWQGDEQTAWIVLVYNDAETAQKASDELRERLDSFVSFITRRTFSEALESMSAEIRDIIIYETEDKAVMMLPITYPIPPNQEQEGDMGMLRSSSMFFRMLMSEYISRGLYFLAVDL